MLETTAWAAALLPADRPRYFMGIGDPEGILEVIERGDRHVRLRPADAHGAHRQRAHLGGAPQPPERPLRPRPARRSTRAAPARPARASRARTSATSSTSRSCSGLRLLTPAQPALPARSDRGRARGDRAGRASPRTRRPRWPGCTPTERWRREHRLPAPPRPALHRPVDVPDPPAAPAAARRRRRCRTSSGVGDEIITAGGLYATVVLDRGRRGRARDRARAPWSGSTERADRRAIVPDEATRPRRSRAGARAGGGSRGAGLLRRRLTCLGLSHVESALTPDPGRPDPRWRSSAWPLLGGPRLAGAQEADARPRPPGRPRGRPQGGAAEGPPAHLGRPRPLGRRSCGTASTSSASPSPRSASRARTRS